MSQISMIVDRCHVSDSHRAVIRYFISRLRHGYDTWRKIPKDARRRILREVVSVHAANRMLYRSQRFG